MLCFNVSSLARLFRNLKRVNSFKWSLHFDSINHYTLTGSHLVDSVCAAFKLADTITWPANVPKSITLVLNEEFLDYIQKVSLAEACETYLSVNNLNEIRINEEQLLTTLVRIEYADLPILDVIKSSTDDSCNVSLLELPLVLKSLATASFDLCSLHVDTVANQLRLVNETTSMLTVIPKTSSSKVHSRWCINELSPIHSLISGLKIRIEEENQELSLFDDLDLNNNPTLNTDTNLLSFDYESHRSGKNIYYDTCYLWLDIVCIKENNLNSVVANIDWTYKVDLTNSFLSSLYKKVKEDSLEVSSFLSKPTEVRIGMRELAWLTRLSSKHGTLSCVLSKDNILMVTILQSTYYLTLYSKRENVLST